MWRFQKEDSRQKEQLVQRPWGGTMLSMLDSSRGASWLEWRDGVSDLHSCYSQKSPLLFAYQLTICVPWLGHEPRNAGPLSICSSTALSAPHASPGPQPPLQQGLPCHIPYLKCICPGYYLKTACFFFCFFFFFASEYWIQRQLRFPSGNLISFSSSWHWASQVSFLPG